MVLAKVLLGELFSVFWLPEKTLVTMTRFFSASAYVKRVSSPVYGGLFGFLHLSKGEITSVSQDAVKKKNTKVQITLDTCLHYQVTHPVQKTVPLSFHSPSSL